ncbi:MAG TPA: pentapeptide MXKDX repeat protein [Bradyrhizobium sp.]|nr:pentapeptide MXKDX repeat protein [Bradyrhizobium sp.]
MKNVHSVVVAMCLVLGAGSVFAQDNGMPKGTMSHDETTQAHDGMKKNAMGHDAMKMDTMSKGHMAKGTMSKGGHMMKKSNMSQNAMPNDGAQH